MDLAAGVRLVSAWGAPPGDSAASGVTFMLCGYLAGMGQATGRWGSSSVLARAGAAGGLARSVFLRCQRILGFQCTFGGGV